MKVALLAAENELARYAHSLSCLEDLEWVGYCLTPGTEDAASFEVDYPLQKERLPRAYSSPQQLASNADLVLVGGQPEQRFDYISSLLRQGKPVWSDWPLSTADSKVHKLAALAEEAHVCTHVAHQGRNHSLWLDALPYLKKIRIIRTEISCPQTSDLDTALTNDLFPYLDRVLSIEHVEVKRVQARKVQTTYVDKFSVQVEIEFFSGMLAEFWLSNVMPQKAGTMRCINADSVVDLDFVGFEISRQDAKYPEKRAVIKVEPNRTMDREAFLTRDLQQFTMACRQGGQSGLDFAESGRVQDVLFQIRRILL